MKEREPHNKSFISHSGCNTLEMEWNVGFFVLFSSFPFAFFMLSFHSIIKKQRGKGKRNKEHTINLLYLLIPRITQRMKRILKVELLVV